MMRGPFFLLYFLLLFLQQHIFPPGILNIRAQTCEDVLMPQAITGNPARFTGLLKQVGAITRWQYLQKAMLCLNLLFCFHSVSFNKAERVAIVSNADQSISSLKDGHLGLSESVRLIALLTKVNKQRLPPHYLEWDLGPPHGLRWSSFRGSGDVSLNTQIFISRKST